MGAVPATAWSVPRAPGKWSPAEESEHITLAHELFADQLAGGRALDAVTSGWRRVALHWIVMPWILRTGRFPRARSPREAAPAGVALPCAVLTARLGAASRAVRSGLECRGKDAFRVRLPHPYFGDMTCVQLLRLTAVHTRHHLLTLSRATVGQRFG